MQQDGEYLGTTHQRGKILTEHVGRLYGARLTNPVAPGCS